MVTEVTVSIGIAEVVAALGAAAFIVVIFIILVVVIVVVVYGIVSPQQSAQTQAMPHAVFRWMTFVDVRKQGEGEGLAPYAS